MIPTDHIAPRLRCSLVSHRDLGFCAHCREHDAVDEVAAWRLRAIEERGVPAQPHENGALTERELFVIARLIGGRSVKQIATEAGVGSTRISNILREVRDRHDAATSEQLIARLVGSGAICDCGAALSRDDCTHGPAVRPVASYGGAS